jgi:hypothetical protein
VEVGIHQGYAVTIKNVLRRNHYENQRKDPVRLPVVWADALIFFDEDGGGGGMKETELNPCKCGCEAELVSTQTFAWCNVYWYVRCSNEDCQEQTMLKYDSKRDAIAAWNRRADNEKRAD